MIKFFLLLAAYTAVALIMCAFIMANDDSESLGSPSPISTVRSTQRGSIVEYIISGLVALFFVLCILMNRLTKPNVVTQLIDENAQVAPKTTEEEISPESEEVAAGPVLDLPITTELSSGDTTPVTPFEQDSTEEVIVPDESNSGEQIKSVQTQKPASSENLVDDLFAGDI